MCDRWSGYHEQNDGTPKCGNGAVAPCSHRRFRSDPPEGPRRTAGHQSLCGNPALRQVINGLRIRLQDHQRPAERDGALPGAPQGSRLCGDCRGFAVQRAGSLIEHGISPKNFEIPTEGGRRALR